MNLSNKTISNEDESVPLNLCVKKKSSAASQRRDRSAGAVDGLNSEDAATIKLVNALISSHQAKQQQQQQQPQSGPIHDAAALAVANAAISQQLQNLYNQNMMVQQQQQQLPPQPKKRGRKPKSAAVVNQNNQLSNFVDSLSTNVANNLLASHFASQQTAGMQNIPSTSAAPRKRGRPPTLSPPEVSLTSVPMAPSGSAVGNNKSKANNSGAFNPSAYPFNIFNNPELLANWPGLNALTTAAAAAASSSSSGADHHQFNNAQNLMNAKALQGLQQNFNNLLFNNLKNASAMSDSSMQPQQASVKPSKSRSNNSNKQQLEDANLFANLFRNSLLDMESNKNSSAHSSHANEKQIRIPLNHK